MAWSGTEGQVWVELQSDMGHEGDKQGRKTHLRKFSHQSPSPLVSTMTSSEFENWPERGKIGVLKKAASRASHVLVHTEMMRGSDGREDPIWWYYFAPSRTEEVQSDFDWLPDDHSIFRLVEPLLDHWVDVTANEPMERELFGVMDRRERRVGKRWWRGR